MKRCGHELLAGIAWLSALFVPGLMGFMERLRFPELNDPVPAIRAPKPHQPPGKTAAHLLLC